MKLTKSTSLLILCFFAFGAAAGGQKNNCKSWTYDFSEVVKYSETPLAACQNYVKEKYPNENYKASVEATGDREIFRCSGDDTYIGIVYQKECRDCCQKPSQNHLFSEGVRSPLPLTAVIEAINICIIDKG